MADNTNMGNWELAQAYVLTQPYNGRMATEQSLICGTAFADLSDPYPKGFHLWLNGGGVYA